MKPIVKIVDVLDTLTRKVIIMKKLLWVLSFIASAVFTYASYKHWVGFQLTEVLGFITGGYCVWLAVVENIWNWPIGIINAGFFTVLFMQSRLFADAGLQIVYIILGFLGWYWWLREWMHQRFQDKLRFWNKPYVVIRGSPEQRLAQAIELVDLIINEDAVSLPGVTRDAWHPGGGF